MAKYRTHEEIIQAVLQISNGGALLSHVLSRVGLSSYQWMSLWHELVYMDLIAEMDGCYSTTEKGIEWLEQYAVLKAIEDVASRIERADQKQTFTR